MKVYQIVTFIIVITIVYSAAHYYLYLRSLQAFSPSNENRKFFFIGLFSMELFFILGMLLEHSFSSVFSEWLYKIGTTWLAFLLYFFIAIVAIDIIRALNHFIHFIPEFSPKQSLFLGLSVCVAVCITVFYGHLNALDVQVKQIPISIHKQVTGNKNVKILMASDLHFGAIIGEKWERKFLQIVEQQKPDLVLLCGDFVDGEIAPVLRQRLGKHIQEISTPLGMYAITGNHEYIGGIDKALTYLKSINIRVLIDEVVTLPNGIQLVGRNDVASRHQRPLDSLMQGIDFTKPIIVMNHQPYNLQEVVDAKADLQLSGHTHNGQMWPFNYITKAIFELSWGYLKKGDTQFYVSSGYGSWGPTVRIGNKPEVVVFNVTCD